MPSALEVYRLRNAKLSIIAILGIVAMALLPVRSLHLTTDVSAAGPPSTNTTLVDGTPDDAVQTIYAVGGPYASCIEKIFWREDPGGGVHQPNLEGSGATGWFQFLPSTFASTPQGHEVDIWHSSGEQQVQAVRWLFEQGQASIHWRPLPC